MNTNLQILRYFALCFFALGAINANAQNIESFPNKPVKIVVGYTPGGSTDVIARQVGLALSKLWGQPVVIENKPGAGANLGADFVAKAPPDGYTLLMWHDGLAANASLYNKLSYDPVKDLTPVQTVARVSIVMGVSNNSTARSVKDVIAMVRANPGSLSYASCGPGTPHHIAGEMFKYYMKLDMTHIAYKGCAPAVADILGNHVPVFFQTLSNVTENWKSGRLRVLAVSDPTRLLDFPDLPTMIEAGVPNFLVTPWYGIFAPAGTPKEIISKMNLDIAKVVNGSELNAILKKAHYAPETMTTEQFSKLVVTDIERLGKVIKSAGVTPD